MRAPRSAPIPRAGVCPGSDQRVLSVEPPLRPRGRHSAAVARSLLPPPPTLLPFQPVLPETSGEMIKPESDPGLLGLMTVPRGPLGS